MNVPMADLKAQYQSIGREMDDAIRAVMETGRFILGENVSSLEKDIAALCGAQYGLGVNSGTDALALALAGLGVGPGDEVITTPFTFVATVEVVALLGARPVFADIDPGTFNLDPARIEERITPKTKAILPVHLYGQTADIDPIIDIAQMHGLKVVWDGAQAIGAEYKGKPVGTYADAVTLSFFPTKNLGGAGDGGMVLTNDPELAEKVRYLRFHGSGGSYAYKYVGYCSRLDELQAAVLRVKLPHLPKWNDQRRRNAHAYNEFFADLDIDLPVEKPDNKHIYHQFTIRAKARDELKAQLASAGIASGVYYPSPLHIEEAYRYLGFSEGDLPEAERACREVLSLPVFPEITDEQLAHVAGTVRSFYE